MSTKPIELIIHIGQHKTGSSAIQDYLFRNQRQLFEEHATLYPDFQTEGYLNPRHFIQEMSLFHLFKSDNVEQSLQVLGNCVEFCLERSISKLIISSESLCGRKWWVPVFHALEKKYNIDTKVFVYLRRQDCWAESAWKQAGSADSRYKNIQDFVHNSNMDWYKMLLPWTQIFKKEQFIFRPYEKVTIGQDVVSDFLMHVGLSNLCSIDQNEASPHLVNPGYTNEVLEIINLCKVENIIREKTKLPYNPITVFLSRSLSDKFRRKTPFKNYGLLSPAERLEIIEKYNQSNQTLANYFFPSGEGKLFNEPLPDPDEPWQAPAPLTLETAIPVIMDLLISLYNISLNNSRNIKDSRAMFFRRLKQQNVRFDHYKSSGQVSLHQAIKKLEDRISKFELSSNTDFEELLLFERFELDSFLKGIKYKNDISEILKTEQGIVCMSGGTDPYVIFRLPKLRKGRMILKIEITSPDSTVFQLFYRTRMGMPFKESNSIKKKLLKGKNVVYLRVPVFRINRKIRIDPGTLSGQYIIHNMSIAT